MNNNAEATAYKDEVKELLQTQASCFHGMARVYAPYYRQCSYGMFEADMGGEGETAIEYAYSDIKRAFQYYLDKWNNKRPIILAGHGQGSIMLTLLIKEFFLAKKPHVSTNVPLRQQLVCAYLPGVQVGDDIFPSGQLKFAETRTQSNCVVTWNTVAQERLRIVKGRPTCWGKKWHKSVEKVRFTDYPWCVNPVTGGTGTRPIGGDSADADRHAGALLKEKDCLYQGIVKTQADGVGYLTGQGSGFLLVQPGASTMPMSKWDPNMGDMFTSDYTLFWSNIRKDCHARIDNYFGGGTVTRAWGAVKGSLSVFGGLFGGENEEDKAEDDPYNKVIAARDRIAADKRARSNSRQ